MVGLERGTVRLEPYREAWEDRYDAERRRLNEVAGDRILDVEHIGSTAVEGIPAKPVIDVLALVGDLADARALTPVLERHGYERRPEDVDGRLFFAKGPRTKRTVYLSVAERGSDFHEEKIAFRDHLREHPETAERYASLKQQLAERYPENREAYTAGKGEFVRDVLDAAMRE
jgi:GrpB-like predicted nucleotidyltransferase (UPF0157 family)